MAELPRLRQSPTDPEFVQDPYRFYTEARAAGPIVFWEDYDMPMATTAETVGALLRDRRLGREIPNPPEVPDRLAPFYAIDAHSMLELEPPRHTRLRSLVLRAFTSRRIAALEPAVRRIILGHLEPLAERSECDIQQEFGVRFPMDVISLLLGIPESDRDWVRDGYELVLHRDPGDTGRPAGAVEKQTEMREYLGKLLDERRLL